MKKPKRAGRVTDRQRMDFLEANEPHLDASCASIGVRAYLDVCGARYRFKTIRQAIDAAIREGKR